ncbi:hypothetical protein HYC85_027693 [Camellia sinensis]|uniref:Defective in cullin neddylation protein n=1 Tax=Camellia sinensis TaxID=4442 RepID=A0A7J7FT76_CAMSI|nr:hypothetical protein HYC85_027693 [Camellia sinensis]
MELLQELSQIVLVDAEELQLSRHVLCVKLCGYFADGTGLLLEENEKFCEIYDFAFGWAKEKVCVISIKTWIYISHYWFSAVLSKFLEDISTLGQKSLALDTAIRMWQLLFEEKQWPLVNHWCQFLQVA